MRRGRKLFLLAVQGILLVVAIATILEAALIDDATRIISGILLSIFIVVLTVLTLRKPVVPGKRKHR